MNIVLAEKFGATDLNDTIDQADLLIKRHQYIGALDWMDFSKNYGIGYAAIYLLIEATLLNGGKHTFPFLIAKDKVAVGWSDNHAFDVSGSRTRRADIHRILKNGLDFNQAFPMLVRVGDFVDCPQGIGPSWIWSLGFDERPLIGREFLFYSAFNSGVWEDIRLPVVHASEWEAYARSAPSIQQNQIDDHFVERTSEVPDCFNDFPSKIIWKNFFEACDYVSKLTVLLDSHGVGFRIDKPIDAKFDVIKLGLSAFDLFM